MREPTGYRAGGAVAFARAHGLTRHLDRAAVATILNNPAADERTAELLALGFRQGFEACQREDEAKRLRATG